MKIQIYRKERSTLKKANMEFPSWRSGLRIRRGTMRLQVRSLALLRGLRIWHCRELWSRSQTQLGSGVAEAAAAAGSCIAPVGPLAWEFPYATHAALKKKRNSCLISTWL